MTGDKFININEPLNENFQEQSCTTLDENELNNSIDKFIRFFKKLDTTYNNNNSENVTNQLTELKTSSIDNIKKISTLWDFLDQSYDVNIDYVKTNFDNMKQIQNDLNTFSNNDKEVQKSIDTYRTDLQNKEKIYKKEMDEYNTLVEKTNILKIFFYVSCGLLLVPLLYSFNVIDKKISAIILIISVLAALTYVIYKFVNN